MSAGDESAKKQGRPEERLANDGDPERACDRRLSGIPLTLRDQIKGLRQRALRLHALADTLAAQGSVERAAAERQRAETLELDAYRRGRPYR